MVKVLVIDDEVPIRQWLEFCINKMEGYQVVGAAANGAEGYSMFRRTLPDIVITDIRMPVMDGLEMLKMIQNVNPAVYAAVLTSHEDFEYARQAMKLGVSEYILKTEITEESLRQALDKGRKGMEDSGQSGLEKSFEEISNRNHYLRSLVLSRHEGTVSSAMLREYEIPLEKGPFVALDIMVLGEEIPRLTLPEGRMLEPVIKFSLDLVHIMVLGNLGKDASHSRSRQMEEIRGYCGRIMEQTECRIGCSDIYENLSQIGLAMRQANDRVKLGFYHPRERLFLSQPDRKHSLTGAEKYKILFSRELVNQNFRRALEIKDEMTAAARAEEATDIEGVKELYLYFLTSLLHMTMDDVDKAEERLEAMNQDLAAAASMDELDQVMGRAFQKYGPGGTFSQDYSAPIRSAIQYMEEHYPESITLPEAAAHVGLSAEYLSRLFREETGVKFIVFLNNLKLKHALRLLETTNLKVYEVAEKVGYSNLSYFSTVFKKNFGQNPFDYKNNCKNGGGIL